MDRRPAEDEHRFAGAPPRQHTNRLQAEGSKRGVGLPPTPRGVLATHLLTPHEIVFGVRGSLVALVINWRADRSCPLGPLAPRDQCKQLAGRPGGSTPIAAFLISIFCTFSLQMAAEPLSGPPSAAHGGAGPSPAGPPSAASGNARDSARPRRRQRAPAKAAAEQASDRGADGQPEPGAGQQRRRQRRPRRQQDGPEQPPPPAAQAPGAPPPELTWQQQLLNAEAPAFLPPLGAPQAQGGRRSRGRGQPGRQQREQGQDQGPSEPGDGPAPGPGAASTESLQQLVTPETGQQDQQEQRQLRPLLAPRPCKARQQQRGQQQAAANGARPQPAAQEAAPQNPALQSDHQQQQHQEQQQQQHELQQPPVELPGQGAGPAQEDDVQQHPLCLICCTHMAEVGFGQCNHGEVCGGCTLRLRLCYGNRDCPLCKAQLDEVGAAHAEAPPPPCPALPVLPCLWCKQEGAWAAGAGAAAGTATTTSANCLVHGQPARLRVVLDCACLGTAWAATRSEAADLHDP